MYAIEKLQQHGVKWFIRRVIRELIKPTTGVGLYLKPLSPLFYVFISKPANFIWTSFKFTDTVKDTLYFFYDFDIEPITYDFVWALCVANARREELGLDFLQVVFVPGTIHGLRAESAKYNHVVNYDSRIWRIYSMLLPCIRLLSCRCGITLCATREEANFIMKNQAKFVYPREYNVTFPIPYSPEEAQLYGQKLLCLQVDQDARKYISEWLQLHSENKKVIVVTLRQYSYTSERNSNISSWIKFAHQIDRQKYFIVFVPDTEEALRYTPIELQDFCVFSEPCWNLNLRAALYELAYLNLGVNTGPMSLCWFNSKCRYITFKIAVKNVPDIPLKMITSKGINIETNPIFTGDFQKWIWDDDDFEVIIREFKMMCDIIDFAG